MNTDIPAGSADIPQNDLPLDAEQPETQGLEPVEAELGEDGQGDLAPEDLDPMAEDPEHPSTPQDLRTALPPDEQP